MINRSFALWVLVGLAGYLSFLVIQAYWQYVIFAALFAILCMPLHRSMRKTMSTSVAAAILTAAVVLLIVLPSIYIAVMTVRQAPSAYASVLTTFDKESFRSLFGVSGDQLRTLAIALNDKLKQNVLTNAGAYLNQASNVLIGIGVMFLTTFFLLRDGSKLVRTLVRIAPVRTDLSERFLNEMNATVRGVILGQVATALVQGLLVGLLFWALGLPNPLFWGVIATLLSVIPILGPFLIYLPAGVYLIVQERYIAGGFLILFGSLLISQIDNVIRPYVMSKSANVHPLIPILGVIGGLRLWGFAGFILGPLALAAFVTLVDFATNEDAVEVKTKKSSR